MKMIHNPVTKLWLNIFFADLTPPKVYGKTKAAWNSSAQTWW